MSLGRTASEACLSTKISRGFFVVTNQGTTTCRSWKSRLSTIKTPLLHSYVEEPVFSRIHRLTTRGKFSNHLFDFGFAHCNMPPFLEHHRPHISVSITAPDSPTAVSPFSYPTTDEKFRLSSRTRTTSLDVDAYRFRGDDDADRFHDHHTTNSRALKLLEKTAASVYQQDKAHIKSRSSRPPATLTTRQAAQLKYQAHQVDKAAFQAKLKRQQEQFCLRTPPKLVVPRRPETLATSTRPRPRAMTAIRADPESIAGMKCQLQWQQEEEAQTLVRKLLLVLPTHID
jgi:hypothetical protein